MNTITSDYSLSSEDIEVLDSALNIFISNTPNGISKARKNELDTCAKFVRYKLQNKEKLSKSKEYYVMYISLINFRIVINETCTTGLALKNDSKKYLSIIDNLLNGIKGILEINGIHID